ncbi:low molecular weight protein-tyrosine-phosphatase [Pelagicoccus sp. SDUM812003]|uniref:low molecular weight protein-tyrosine-phosphatase n=1 Tax=Pelagicoccus sp. SDUM812003 TaxID=3041267 RepID=UPI00280F73B6|nr:low molecular weight protein-tyrosine-phosphatase [Pelagicoccus sp. SDUM812003]MDQ8201725.1 low molecular weight phosphotyrosine protein phosphatase [Pelagicoccus sp. SDUM812003]
MSTQPTSISSILFVCMGNICRSPAGENVMRKLLQDAGLQDQVECDSAGTIGYHTGNSPDARMSAAGRKRGLPMTGRARQVVAEDLDRFDLVLAMDNDNYADLMQLATDENRAKVKRFCDFCIEYSDTQVPDPYYGGAQGFEHVLDLLEDGCQQILEAVQDSRS